ncbi:Protein DETOXIFICATION 17 [Bienertia sinuspersici]
MLFSLQLISIMFVGHLGELPLSGASMATSFASVTGFSLLVSLPQLCLFFLLSCLYLFHSVINLINYSNIHP